MTLVLGFGPFILFALLSRLSADLALWTSFAAAFVVTVRDFVERPALRLLDGTGLALFGLLALWRGFLDPALTLAAVRTLVDLAASAVLLISLLARRPLSLAYAGRAGWDETRFRRVNYAITLGWLLAFAAMALADGAVMAAGMPLSLGIAVNIAGFAFAIILTLRYPAWAARRN